MNTRSVTVTTSERSYKGYFVKEYKGQISFSCGESFIDESYELAYFPCQFKIRVLVNEEHLTKFNDTALKMLFINNRRNLSRVLHENKLLIANEYRKEGITFVSRTVDIGDIKFDDTPYLINSFESIQDVILLDLDLTLDTTKAKLSSELNNIPKRKYFLISYFGSDNMDFIDWFMNLHSVIHNCCKYDFMSQRKFKTILNRIGQSAYEWIQNRKVTNTSLRVLKQIKDDLEAREYYPLTDFCYKFFNDLVDDLIKSNQIIMCANYKVKYNSKSIKECKGFAIRYRHNLTYCSPACRRSGQRKSKQK